MKRTPSLRKSVPGLLSVLRYFWPWMRHERALIAGSTAAMVAGVLMRLAEPWPLKFVLDRVIPTGRPAGMNSLPLIDSLEPMTLLALCAVGVVALTGLRALFDYEQRVGLARIGNRVLRKVRNHVYAHVQGLSLSFHTQSRGGDVIMRVTRDVGLLRDVVSTAVMPMVANVMVLVAMFSIMVVLEWKLALLASLTLPLFWFSTMRISKGIHQAARKQRQREGAMAATVSESITAIRDVQALALEETFLEDFTTSSSKNQKEEMKTAKLSAQLGRTVDTLLALATAGVLWYGAVLVMRGSLTPGDLLVFLTYLKRAFRPAKDFAKHTGRLAKATAAGERVLTLLELTPDVQDRPGAREAAAFHGTVRFDNVSFAYDADAPVLRSIDLEVEPGRTLVLTGESGGGKSTLVSLLLRLYDPTGGRVLIDGHDIRDFTLASLRSQITVVLQDPTLFAASIRENIACGLEGVTAEQIEAAARQARADGFIAELPDGYETTVGERGATLSRGQRQRICIARAALRATPILILDEPTTGLDKENKREVVEALRRLAAGRTTFLITHDLGLVARADRAVVLDDGELVERGVTDEGPTHGARAAGPEPVRERGGKA